MRTFIRLVSLLAALLCIASSARAFRQWDYSDLYYMPGEDGWGLNVAQQDDTMFATLFVYGPDRKPTWYVASSMTYSGIQDSQTVFAGILYQTSGPSFTASTFDPHGVTTRQVGTMSLKFKDPVSGVLSYSIDGASYFKEVRRQTWKALNLPGSYIGQVVGQYFGTACGARTGYQEEPATFVISLAGSKATIVATETSRTCTYTGDYVQFGRAGEIDGFQNGMSCTDGTHGGFQFAPVEYTAVGFTAAGIRFTDTNACSWSGHMGGVVRSELPN